jgi:hypothetical protein
MWVATSVNISSVIIVEYLSVKKGLCSPTGYGGPVTPYCVPVMYLLKSASYFIWRSLRGAVQLRGRLSSKLPDRYVNGP